MADDAGVPDFIDTNAGNGDNGLPQVGILAQYVKDLSFENPNSPAVFQWQGQPQMDVQVNIGVQGVGQDVHEVVLKIEVEAKGEQGVAFRVELLYAGLFALRNIPEEQLQPFLLAEAPRLLFPFARRIISDAVDRRRLPAPAARSDRLRRPLHAERRPAAGGGHRQPVRRHRPGLRPRVQRPPPRST